jgi:hypothetical protein
MKNGNECENPISKAAFAGFALGILVELPMLIAAFVSA